MSSEQANYRKVLASFLEEIPKNKGWWYRLPLAPISSKGGVNDDMMNSDSVNVGDGNGNHYCVPLVWLPDLVFQREFAYSPPTPNMIKNPFYNQQQ